MLGSVWTCRVDVKVGRPLATLKEELAPVGSPVAVRSTDSEVPLVNVTARSNDADCP
jgi:hypothetical protein